jgi:hypothetical protein
MTSEHRPLAYLLTAIRDGKYDRGLDTVVTKVLEASRNRRDVLGQEIVEYLPIGAHVRVKKTSSLKPRYFHNRTGRVTEIEERVVWVTLDTPIVRRARGHVKTVKRIGIPAWNLEVLDDSPV